MTFCDEYSSKPDGIYLANEGETPERFCRPFGVRQVEIDLLTGCQTVVFYVPLSNGRSVTFSVGGEEFSTTLIRELSARGVRIPQTIEARTTLAEVADDMTKNAHKIYRHNALGYKDLDGERIFLGSTAYPPTLKSAFVNNKLYAQKGSLGQWLSEVKQMIDDHPPVLLALAMGASAPLATRLKDTGINTDTLEWALIGKSSQGKSTLLRLAASAWGIPEIGASVKTLADTDSFLCGVLSENSGVPLFLDETSIRTERGAFSSLIYGLSFGVEKGRSSSTGENRPQRRWSGAVIFTGEVSVLQNSNCNGGLFARLIEFDEPWTGSEKRAKRISNLIKNNYGHSWLPFIETLEQKTDQELTEIHFRDVAALKDALSNRGNNPMAAFNGVQSRVLCKLAILSSAARILCEAWKISFQEEKFFGMLLTAFDRCSESTDKVDMCYEALLDHIDRHGALFPYESKKNTDFIETSNKQGVRGKQNHRSCVWILSPFFETFLTNNGLSSSKSVLREFYEKNLLYYSDSRYQFKKGPKGSHGRYYCLFLDRGVASVEKEIKKTPNLNNRKNLLTDDDETPDEPEYYNNGGAEE